MILEKLTQSVRTVTIAQIKVTVADLEAFFTKKPYVLEKPSVGPDACAGKKQ
jgi:hypothetical protein